MYWTALDNKWPQTLMDRLAHHRKKEGMVKARVEAFGDCNLSSAFDELQRKFALFRGHIDEKEPAPAYDVMKEARQISGTILKKLQPRMPER